MHSHRFLPDFDELRCENIRGSVENNPLIDQDAYYDLVRSVCDDIIVRLTVDCSWSNMGNAAFDQILEDYYNQQLHDSAREKGVVPEVWNENSPGDWTARQEALTEVMRFVMDEVGNRRGRIIRQAKRAFLKHAQRIEIRVRRDEIEIVDVYQSADNIPEQNYLDHKLARNNARLR